MKNIKYSIIVLFFVALFLNSLSAGSQNIKELFASANKSFEIGNYYGALGDLHQLINSQDQILEKKNALINYMYAKSLLYLINNSNDSVSTKLSLSGYNLPLQCFKSYEIALSSDINYSEKINADFKELLPFIIKAANTALEEDLLTYAQNFSSIAKIIDKDNIQNKYISAVIDFKREDTVSAENLFKTVLIELDTNNSNNTLMISKSLYFLAIIDNRLYKNADLAIVKINEAIRILEKGKTENSITTSDYWENKKTYSSYLLDIYLNIPEKEEEAIIKFKEAITNNLNNYSLTISLAQLLSKNHKEEAIDYYNKAIQIDPSNYTAYYNLGAIYLNEGINFFDLSKTTKDPKLAKQYYFNYQEKYAEAYVWMQSAFERNKEDLNILYSLKRIAAGLYYPDDYQQYEMMITKLEYRKSVKGK
ncbi:MAG: tetratricopeptide repeat protein [Bacteroidota bacterium]